LHAVPAPARHVGIIGGGQLGLLLCRAAQRLGIRCVVLTDDPAGPAAHAADEVLVAALHDTHALSRLIERVEVITFELEAVPDVALDALEEAAGRGLVSIQPGVGTLRRLKDKGLQKVWLHGSGFPTLPFRLTDAATSPADLLAGPIVPPLVQKTRRGGYDGKGVQVLRDRDALARLWPVPGLVEPAVEDILEVAVVVARDAAGGLYAYPPVTMHFDPALNAVSCVTSPGELEETVRDRCLGLACDVVAALGASGVFAVELFVLPQGEIFINEISPRVHNSGHLTIDAFDHDQFEQHLRAVSGRPLAPAEARAPAAVMLNLLYEDSLAPALSAGPYQLALDPGQHTILHWYGKPAPRPGRKMGHITALGASPQAALARAHAGLARLRSGDVRPPETLRGVVPS